MEPKKQEMNEERMWPNGPTTAQMDEWKARYKRVYLANFDDDKFVFRELNRTEFRELRGIKGADTFYLEDRMCERCVLWPQNLNFQTMGAQKAGIPSTLSQIIMESSGFAEVSEMDADEMLEWVDFAEDFTQEDFDNAKKKYSHLYYIRFANGEFYLIRGLNRKEYKDLKKVEMEPLFEEEKICDTCVVYPKDYNFTTMKKTSAGIPTTLSNIILQKSGFTEPSVSMFD